MTEQSRETFEGLLAILTDESKYKGRLAEVTALEKKTAENVKTYSALAKKAEEDKKAAQAAQELMAAQHNEIHQRLLPREEQVQRDAEVLQQKQAKLDADIHNHRQDVDKVSAVLTRRETFVSGREQQIKDDQAQIEKDRADVDALRDSLLRRHKALEEAMKA